MTDIHMTKPNTVSSLKARKGGTPIVCLTAYSAPMAQILDQHCDLLLVGDSIGMALYGMENTLGVTLDMMINHGRAVSTHTKNALVAVDMPYGTYETSADVALNNAKKLMNEAGCDAVKLEGGQDIAPIIKHLVQHDIPVVAHIGLQPQSVEKEGGYRVKGKTDEDIKRLIRDAEAVAQAGAFAVVIEGTIETVAKEITSSITIPTIGIGASADCDGQILVSEDMLGITQGHTAKFVKHYANIAQSIETAAIEYAQDVRTRAFPEEAHTYKSKRA